MRFSVIIPVYNRPDEIHDVLSCLSNQTFKDFEVIVVESGSEKRPSDAVVKQFEQQLQVRHLWAGNNGPGLSRNEGMKHAKGDYFVILDSDVLLEPNFLYHIDVAISTRNLDAHGGPDKCHPSFTDVEKAINYTLTSFLTTGGMRGGKVRATTYYPRSFNMGFSRRVYEATGGFAFGFMGEDMELSHRIQKLGFKVGLVSEAFVYHHRKKDLGTFFRYMKFFGKSRVNLMIRVPGSLRLIHLVPVGFLLYVLLTYLSIAISLELFLMLKALFYTYFILIGIDSTIKNKSAVIGLLSIMATALQLVGYGIGFIEDYWKRIVMGKNKPLVNI